MASLPGDLDDANEGRLREVMRTQKARVAMGELDVVGDAVWDNMNRPRMGRVVSESVLNKHTPHTHRSVDCPTKKQMRMTLTTYS
jgi:hypothetical protein